MSSVKVLLTSAGFETKAISDVFLSFINKDPKDIKVLFIPTAAITVEAVAALPLCMDDLLKLEITAKNIKIFDLHRSLSSEGLSVYDAVYFAGGSAQYLLERINATGFSVPLNEFVSKGGVYVGVSAGSIVAAGNLADNLGYLKAKLQAHTKAGTAAGTFDDNAAANIDLTDSNAVVISNGVYKVI